MKRALPAVPLVLFLLFVNACGIPPDQLPNIINQTLIATSWTPTFTPTQSNFDSLSLVRTLKNPLPEDSYLKNAQDLENSIGAKYEIADAGLVEENNFPDRILEVKVTCFCNARSRNCCSPERAFAIVMRRMEYHNNYNGGSLLRMVPATVIKLKVYCIDHANRVGVMASGWLDVVEYLNGRIDATQFGSRAWPE